jgi:hypothetical protein
LFAVYLVSIMAFGHLENELYKETDKLIRELRAISQKAKGQTSRILGKAARPIVDALFLAAPHGRRIHKRYKSAGLNKRIRAGKGKGSVVAIYRPGNLATSFQIFRFGGAKFTLSVGAKLQKGNATGAFGPGTGRTDAYYAHMVEKKQAFVLPTWRRMESQTRERIITDLKKIITRTNTL